MLNQTAEYALRATLYLAAKRGGGVVRVATIAQALDVPRNYLSKVLDVLRRAGILSAERGPSGGFALAGDPEALTLAQVVEPFDPIEDRCLLMRRRCSDADPCLAHDHWKAVAARIRAFFRETTVADLVRERAGEPAEAPLHLLRN